MTNRGFDDLEDFASFDGLRLVYRDAASGPLVVLLHGFASDSFTNWIRTGVADAISELGRRVVLPDARGHGASDKPHDPSAYSHQAMARDVMALVDHLLEREVHLVGYSMGALVAIEVAARDPRVRSLVLGGVGLGQVSVSDPARASKIAQGLEAPDRSEVSDPTALAFRNFADATGADRLALAAIQRSRSRLPSQRVLSSISVPTLVVNGESDTLVGQLDSIALAIEGASFEKVPGDHVSAVAKPEFRRAVVGFLAKLAPTDRSTVGPAGATSDAATGATTGTATGTGGGE